MDKMKNSPRICINIPGGFGDIFQMLFLGSLLKKHFPNCHVGWVVYKHTCASAFQHTPGVDEVIVVDRDISIAEQVARNPDIFANYTHVFTPNCSSFYRAKFGRKAFKNAIHIGASPRSTTGRLAGYLLRHYYDRLYDYDPNYGLHRVQLIYALNQTLGCNITLEELATKEPAFLLPEVFYRKMRPYLAQDRPNIVLVPRTSTPFRDFPEEGFIQLILNTRDVYHYIVTYGSKDEEKTAHRIAAATGATTFHQCHSIHHLAALMVMADMVVGSDTGPTHLAWAQNTKTLALFPRDHPIAPTYRSLFYKLGIYDTHMLSVYCHFPYIIDFLPSLVRSWEKSRNKDGKD